MNNNRLSHRAIVKLLSIYKTDNSLRNLFLRKLDNDMSWTDVETSCKLIFPFIEGDKKSDSWINSFSFLYVYSLLSKWKEQFSDDKTIDERFNVFFNNNKDQIKGNIEEFCDNNITLPSAASDVLYYIDCFNWIVYGLIPKYATSTNYVRYRELLENCIKNEQSQKLDKLIEFSKTVDATAKDIMCLNVIVNIMFESGARETKIEMLSKAKSSCENFFNEIYDTIINDIIVKSVVNEFKIKYPSPLVRDIEENPTWNWGIIKKHVEKCCKYYCRLGHHTFDEGRILRSYELQTTSNKRSNAIRLFVDQIESDLTGARWYIHEKWNEREHADNFSSMQKSYLKNVIEDIVKTKHPSLKDNKTISNSVFSILSGEYIFNFPFNEEKYWKDKEHSLPDCIIDVVNRYAKTCMKLYISSFLFTESIREHITDEEQKSLDTIIKEDLCQALVEAQLNFLRKKLLGKETNKSGNYNQHNSGSQSSDLEDDPRVDPATSWIYQP